MKRGSGCCAVDIHCTAALTSLSDIVSTVDGKPQLNTLDTSLYSNILKYE